VTFFSSAPDLFGTLKINVGKIPGKLLDKRVIITHYNEL